MNRIYNFLKVSLISTLITIPASLYAENDTHVFNPLNYGAKGDGMSDDAVAIQKAIDACTNSGGGQVVIPTGRTFLTGPIELKSNVELHLQANSSLKANPDKSIYQMSAFFANRGEGMMWLHTNPQRTTVNLSITGTGTIDGNGILFMGKELDDSYELLPTTTFDPRPHVLTLFNVNKLIMRDVTVKNSAYWTVHLIGCYNALIDGVSILNNLKIRNCDGIDIDHSRKVRIANCFIEAGDDCICLKNRREYEAYGPCQDITVTNCVMTSRSCSIKIGSENMDEISNVLFDNCVIRSSNRGLGIQNRDEGTVRNVIFSNMIVDCQLYSEVWWGESEPIYVTSYPRAVGNHKDAGWRFPKGATKGACGEVSDIYFNNIKCYTENGCYIGGDVKGKVSGIHMTNVDICFRKRTNFAGGRYDRRPCDGEGFIYDKAYGFYIDEADDVTMTNCNVRCDSSFPTENFGGFEHRK